MYRRKRGTKYFPPQRPAEIGLDGGLRGIGLEISKPREGTETIEVPFINGLHSLIRNIKTLRGAENLFLLSEQINNAN